MTRQPAELPPQANRFVVGGIDRVLTVQRPVVLAHIHSIRSRHPEASPQRVIRILEKRYLAAVTTGGALVGASAVIPAVGVGASFALSAVETGGFLEASALFAQSVTEVHGIAVTDPDRARTLVMTLILGSAGSDLVKQLAGQATGAGPTRGRFWGEMVTKSLPQAAMGQISDRLKKTFVKRFAVQQGTSAIGRAIPFGIGAVVGGTGNNLLGRQIIRSSREAFRDAPSVFPDELVLRVKPQKSVTEKRQPGQPKPPRASRAQRQLDRARRELDAAPRHPQPSPAESAGTEPAGTEPTA